MRSTILLGGVCTLVLLSLLTPSLDAQTRASERGSTTQVVNGTTITFDYARPKARGRTNLFGGVIHWGELWTPGANWATTIDVDHDIKLNGHPLPAGTYSVWMELQPDEWTVRINTVARLYHDAPVPDDQFVMSFPVTPSEGVSMESLAWYFPVVGPTSTTVHMHWGPTYVPLEIETLPFEPPAVAGNLRAAYAGEYAVEGRDPTTTGPLRLTLGVLDENGRLEGRWGRAPLWLIPTGNGDFYLGFLRNGELFDMAKEMTLRMVMEDGRAVGVELLWEGGVPFAQGTRVTPN